MQALRIFPGFRTRGTLTPGGVQTLLLRSRAGVVLRVDKHLHRIAELGLAEQQERMATRDGRVAIVS